MRSFITILTIGLFLFAGVGVASAQKTQDYYKFDDKGFLCEFQLTLPDNTAIKYKHLYNSRSAEFVDGDYANIVYSDGTTIDFSASYKNLDEDTSIYQLWDACPVLKMTEIRSPFSSNQYLVMATIVNDWYKFLKQVDGAPVGAQMLDKVFGLDNYTIIFPDNSHIEVSAGYSKRIVAYAECTEKGDYIRWEGEKLLNINWNQKDIPIIDLQNDKLDKVDCIVSGVHKTIDRSGDEIYNTMEGRIATREGETFTGTFVVISDKEHYCAEHPSPYFRNIFKDYPDSLYSFDAISGILYENGNVVNKKNQVVAMYRDKNKLDEFDMQAQLAAEQGKINQAKAEAEKAAKEKNAMISKYGKKNVDAFFAGKIIVGMPWSLVELGVNANSFKDFTFTTLSIDRGSSKCYDLYNYGFYDKVGFVWVKDGIITSIMFY